MTTNRKKKYAVCVANDGYKASLELGKVYTVLEDADAARHGMLRVVDDDGEDYLYPCDFFSSVQVSARVEATLGR
jgi:hypothetical protein